MSDEIGNVDRPNRVYLSYAAVDGEIANRLSEGLARQGVEVIDPASSVDPGDNISAAIARHIEESDAVVVLVTPQSRQSKWVEAETAMAVGRVLSGRGGRVVPLFIDDAAIPPLLNDFQGIRIRSQSIVDVAERIAALGRSVSVDSGALRESIELQRLSLEYERAAYVDAQRASIERRYRTLMAVTSGTAVILAIFLAVSSFFWNSRWVLVVTGPLVAVLTSAVSFYFGRTSGGRGRER